LVEPVLKATVPGRADLVEIAKSVLAGNTLRLRLEWPKAACGEQPVEVGAPDVEEPLRLLVKRAGGRVTAAGLLVRARPLDEAQSERVVRLASGDEGAAADAAPERTAAGAQAAVEDAEPRSASWGDVRTGDTLPPPSTASPLDERTGDTLPPAPMPRPEGPRPEAEPASEGEERSEPHAEAEGDAEVASESGPESGPEIEFQLAGTIPPELAAELDDEPEAEQEPEAEPVDEEETSAPELEERQQGEPVEPAGLDAAARALLAAESATAERKLLDAGQPGALALCRARVGARVDAGGRSRFVHCLRELGEAALPAISEVLDAALADATELDQPAALEDLLRAAPEVENADLALAVVPMCTHANGRVRHAAVAALPKLYGERAKPELRSALGDDDESVCRAAINGLRRVRGIDVLVLHRLEPILTGDKDASDELRALAAAALVDVDTGQRDAALDALHRALNPRTSMVSLFTKAEEVSPMLVEAICRTMLVIGGRKERRAVSKQAARSEPRLRQRLEALLDQHS
jgi:hypothetical protein